MTNCTLHPQYSLGFCPVCTGVDEYAPANRYVSTDASPFTAWYPKGDIRKCMELDKYTDAKITPIEFKSLQEVLDAMRISKETGAFASDQDFYSMLNCLHISMTNGFYAIKSEIRNMRKVSSEKEGR